MAQSVNTRNTQMLDLNMLYTLLKEVSRPQTPWPKSFNGIMFMNSRKKSRLSITVGCPCHPVLMGLPGLKILLNCGEHIIGIFFNCVKSDEFNVGDVSNNDGVVIRTDEVCCAIEKLAVNKACGFDQITAEHLKYASHRTSVLLAMCFSGLLMHGILPNSMLSAMSALFCQCQ